MKLLDASAYLGFASTVPEQAAMKSGAILKPGRKVTIPHHSGDMAEGTLRAVLREAGINVDRFLNAR